MQRKTRTVLDLTIRTLYVPTRMVIMCIGWLDGMAEVQSLTKPDHVKTCADLVSVFCSQTWRKYDSMDEILIIFDIYDISNSLKKATRMRRQGHDTPVANHISDVTNLAKVSMKHLLLHDQTKMELTGFLGQSILEHAATDGRRVIVAWGSNAEPHSQTKRVWAAEQEESSTKLLLHARGNTVWCIKHPHSFIWHRCLHPCNSTIPRTVSRYIFCDRCWQG